MGRLNRRLAGELLARRDPHADVWKHVLDGLVAIGGVDAYDAILAFRSDNSIGNERESWADEQIHR